MCGGADLSSELRAVKLMNDITTADIRIIWSVPLFSETNVSKKGT